MFKTKSFQKQLAYSILFIIILVFVAYLDYVTGTEVSSILFYIIPLYFFANRKYSTQKSIVFLSIIATVLWYIVETQTRIYDNPMLANWNALVRLTVFTVIGILSFRLNDKLKKLEKSNLDLEKLNKEKNMFIGIAAHDLKNPIATIYSFSDLLLSSFDSKTDEETVEMVGYIKELSTNSLHILDNVLDVSKIESGIITIIKKEQDYISFVKKNIFYNQILANAKSIQINFEKNTDNLVLPFDENYLSEVINNLLTNAIKFSAKDSEIKVRISTDGKTVKTEVIDNGKGIATAEQSKLFNYFQKTSTTPTAGESSTGLGLAISKKIVLQHGGTIGLESQLGKGSNFYFELTF